MFPNLDAEMARKKITKAFLAKKINKSPTTLSLKLNGRAPITLDECIEIRDVVGTEYTIDYLFEVDDVK